MTAPSQTSTDNPASSQPASGDISPEPASAPALDTPAESATPPPVAADWSPSSENAEPSRPTTASDILPAASAADTVEPARRSAPAPREIPPELQPRDLWVEELHALTHRELLERAELLRLRVNAEKNRHFLVHDLLRAYHALGFTLFAEGITEFITSDGSGFVRFPRYSFRPGPQDPFISFQLAKRLHLRGGHLVTARFRPPGTVKNT